MKTTKILLPTDFSDCANNALNYAIELAKDINAELILMHSIIDNEEKKNTANYNKTKESMDKTLAFAKDKNPGLSIRTIIDSGVPELSLSTVLYTEKIDYIIMGTEGASGLKAGIFGSFTSNVLIISPCPVFTIPMGANYHGFKKVTCATELDDSEIKALSQAFELCKKSQSNITLYNVSSDKDEQLKKLNKFKKNIEHLINSLDINYITEESDDVLDSIENHLSEANPDLIITLGKERSFFENFFGTKISKQLCLNTSVPLLSFPPLGKSK